MLIVLIFLCQNDKLQSNWTLQTEYSMKVLLIMLNIFAGNWYSSRAYKLHDSKRFQFYKALLFQYVVLILKLQKVLCNYFEWLSLIIFWICFSSKASSIQFWIMHFQENRFSSIIKCFDDFDLFFYLSHDILPIFSVVLTTMMNLETFSISDSDTFKLKILIWRFKILIFCLISQRCFLNKQKWWMFYFPFFLCLKFLCLS
jgi:hypothetical protein